METKNNKKENIYLPRVDFIIILLRASALLYKMVQSSRKRKPKTWNEKNLHTVPYLLLNSNILLFFSV